MEKLLIYWKRKKILSSDTVVIISIDTAAAALTAT